MHNRWMLMSDLSFRELDIPLRPADRKELEKQIRKKVHIDPIPVWNGYVLMDYDRYHLYEKLHLFYTVNNMSFVRKNEVHAWICREQLKRRDLCRQATIWLLYRLYKALLETEKRKAAKEQFQYKKLSPSRFSDTMPARQTENTNLFKQIGEEYNLSKATIRNYVQFGTQLDQLEEMFPGTRIRILKGQLDVPIMFMNALMQMPREELWKMISDPQCQKLVPPKEIVTEIRNARDPRYKNRIHVETAIKETPAYDPDAELSGLTYTIGAWIRAINHTEGSNLQNTTHEGKERLRGALIRLKIETECLYRMLEEKEHE